MPYYEIIKIVFNVAQQLLLQCCRCLELRGLALPGVTIALAAMLLAACSDSERNQSALGVSGAAVESGSVVAVADVDDGSYRQNSWQALIPEQCEHFFDGCNQCRRVPGSASASCTRKACANYQQPRCLDESDPAGDKAHIDIYLCGEKRISVFYGEYVSDDRKLRLGNNQVVLLAENSPTASVLIRQSSAAGERYRDSAIEFWTQGDTALWQSVDGSTSLSCQRQPPLT